MHTGKKCLLDPSCQPTCINMAPTGLIFVHAMRKLVMGGKDIYVTSPILSAYLGHKSLAATEKYLRLTAEVYPDIVRRFEKHFAAVVPGRYSDAD